MRYWFLMSLALLGGAALIYGSLDGFLPLLGILELIIGIVFLGMGRRMLQQRLHR
jgi:hypothetical protein